MISGEEMQAIVGPIREYVDAKIAQDDERIARIEWQIQSHEDRLNHPALVLDYRAWVIEVAVGLGVTAKELVDAKKKLREGDGDDPRSTD